MTEPPGVLRRISDYLGLTDPPPPGDFNGAVVDGVSVQSLNDVYNVLISGTSEHVTRGDANRLATVVSVRNRIQATVANMPLVQRNPSGLLVDNRWLLQPNPSRPLVNEMSDTIADLFYDKFAYWRVLERGPGANGPGTGFPVKSEWVAQHRVTVAPDGGFTLDGSRISSAEIIQFEGIHSGILHEGAAGAILDAIRLARTAAMFTNSPFPLGYFTDREGEVEATPQEVKEVLREWSSLRRRNAWGHIPGSLELKFPDIDPGKLQLAEARRETTVDFARGANASPEDLGVSTTSRTYFNATQKRKDDLDFQIALYTTPIAQRLSMPDVTPRNHTVSFSTDEFLSVDQLTQGQIYQLGLATGLFADADEVRSDAGKPALTDAQKAARTSSAAPAPGAGRRTTDPGGAKPPASKGSEAK